MTEILPLTCASVIPVYVKTPVELLYASEPSPPESVTEILPLMSASDILKSIAPSPESS